MSCLVGAPVLIKFGSKIRFQIRIKEGQVFLYNLLHFIFLTVEGVKFIGKFSYHAHGVSGDIYSIDGVDNQLHIRRFKYDGTGQNTYFMAGTEASEPNSDGFILEHPFKGKYKAMSTLDFCLCIKYH